MVNTCILTIHYKKITTTDEELTNFKNSLLDLSERIKKSSGIIIEYYAPANENSKYPNDTLVRQERVFDFGYKVLKTSWCILLKE
jgi:hypothetical protein